MKKLIGLSLVLLMVSCIKIETPSSKEDETQDIDISLPVVKVPSCKNGDISFCEAIEVPLFELFQLWDEEGFLGGIVNFSEEEGVTIVSSKGYIAKLDRDGNYLKFFDLTTSNVQSLKSNALNIEAEYHLAHYTNYTTNNTLDDQEIQFYNRVFEMGKEFTKGGDNGTKRTLVFYTAPLKQKLSTIDCMGVVYWSEDLVEYGEKASGFIFGDSGVYTPANYCSEASQNQDTGIIAQVAEEKENTEDNYELITGLRPIKGALQIKDSSGSVITRLNNINQELVEKIKQTTLRFTKGEIL